MWPKVGDVNQQIKFEKQQQWRKNWIQVYKDIQLYGLTENNVWKIRKIGFRFIKTLSFMIWQKTISAKSSWSLINSVLENIWSWSMQINSENRFLREGPCMLINIFNQITKPRLLDNNVLQVSYTPFVCIFIDKEFYEKNYA